jgi:hypothetical protein
MPLTYHAVRASCLRLAAILCFGAAVGLAGPASGMTRIEVFQATVPDTDHSEAGQTAAFQAAMKVVLVRATGRRASAEDAVFAPLVGNARRYVQQYRTTPDRQLWVAFDGPALERWLTQNGQPLWGKDRPSTFVWLSVQNGTQSSAALSADDTSELKSEVDAAAALRGIPLVWPTAEAVAANASSANPSDLGHHLGAEGVLIGRANNLTAGASVRWTLLFQERSQDFSGLQDGVNRAADLYAGMYAASGNLEPVEIEVSGVGDLQDYAHVQAFLESLNFITHVGIESLSGDLVRYRLTMRGGIEPLQHAIALNGRLQSLPGGENGIQRFQLRR